MQYIGISDGTKDKLVKYCNERIRPVQLHMVMGRILRRWCMKIAKVWIQDKETIPSMKKIPEKALTQVAISDTDYRMFKRTLSGLNGKMNTEIDPASLASFLAEMFIKAYDIERKSKGYKFSMGRVRRK